MIGRRGHLWLTAILLGACTRVAIVGENSDAGPSTETVCTSVEDVSRLEPRHWCRVANSRMSDALKPPRDWPDFDGARSASFDSYNGWASEWALNWDGAAYDSSRDRLIVMAGGGSSYFGNELLAFEADRLRWIRLTDPTPFPEDGVTGAYRTEGPPPTPLGRNTYSGILYLSSLDRVFIFAGGRSTDSAAVRGAWSFDLSAIDRADPEGNRSLWEDLYDPSEPRADLDCNFHYDPVLDRVFYHRRGDRGAFCTYGVQERTWRCHRSVGRAPSSFAILVPAERRIYEFNGEGMGDLRIWELPSTTDGLDALSPSAPIATGGDDAIEMADDPAIIHDPVSDALVAYAGGTAVYTFDRRAMRWTRVDSAPGNRTDPGPVRTAGGVFGRFRRLESLDVYVYIAHPDDDVFLYRPER